MDDIINKIYINKNSNIDLFDKINGELSLKIEQEKTKQLELIKDIKKIEKSIKEKELYCKRNLSKKIIDNFNSDTNSDTEYDSDSNSYDDSDLDDNPNYKNIIINKKKNNNDTLSMCSIDSQYDYDKEINII